MLGPGIGAEEREAIEVASSLVMSDSEGIPLPFIQLVSNGVEAG